MLVSGLVVRCTTMYFICFYKIIYIRNRNGKYSEKKELLGAKSEIKPSGKEETHRAPSWSDGTSASPWARCRGSPEATSGTWPHC
jgi:hypothetical protein